MPDPHRSESRAETRAEPRTYDPRVPESGAGPDGAGDGDRSAGQGPQPVDWRLLRFLARHCATGVAAGWALLLGLIWTDVAGIGGLIHGSTLGWLGLLMLAGAFGLTGGAVAMGVAVMGLARKGDT